MRAWFALLLCACAAGGRTPVAQASSAEAMFVTGMILHHEQALVMTGLVGTRTAREDVRALAGRIERSQDAEIARMRRWLAARGVSADATSHAHHAMPGMLTSEQMQELREATGTSFDRRFLELMIQHHEGALEMVRTLRTEDPELYRFAADVDADQRAEIARMRRMLTPERQP